jgi:hypothetical protein
MVEQRMVAVSMLRPRASFSGLPPTSAGKRTRRSGAGERWRQAGARRPLAERDDGRGPADPAQFRTSGRSLRCRGGDGAGEIGAHRSTSGQASTAGRRPAPEGPPAGRDRHCLFRQAVPVAGASKASAGGIMAPPRARPSCSGLQHDLYAVVLLVQKHVVSFRSILETQAVGDDEAGIDLALLDPFE